MICLVILIISAIAEEFFFLGLAVIAFPHHKIPVNGLMYLITRYVKIIIAFTDIFYDISVCTALF